MGRSLVSTLHDESVEGDIAEISVVVEEELILHRILLYAQVELGVGDKSERFFGVELLQIPVLSAIFFFHKEAGSLLQHVRTFYPIAMQHIGRAIDSNADFR